MPIPTRQQCLLRPLTLLIAALLSTAPAALHAATTVTSIAPGAEGPYIAGMGIEDFEDVNLVPGVTFVFSVWRSSANVILANPAVSYTGTLPQTWTSNDNGFPNNPWDGTRTLINGWGHDWAYPFAASVELQFSPARSAIGVGLSNVQTDAGSGNTTHTLWVNGVSKGNLESLPGWVSNVYGKNRYLLVSGEPISSVRVVANTHFDGMAFDKLALGTPAGPTPATGTTWGRLKTLYR